MADPIEKLLPRFRYGVIHPRANEEFQRGPAYQLYRLVPLDVMEISTGLGLENYTPEGVEKAVGNAKRELIQDHIDHCLEGAIGQGGRQAKVAMAEVKAITKYL